MSRFSSMLDRTSETIKAPPTLPSGIYLVKVKKPHEVAEIKAKDGIKTFEKVTVSLAVIEPYEVDEDLLEEYGRSPAGLTLNRDFLFDTEDETAAEDSLNRLKIFLQDHLKCLGEGDSIETGMENMVGATCLAEVQHRADNRPGIDRVYAEIRRTLAEK